MSTRTSKVFDVSGVAGSGQFVAGTVVAPDLDTSSKPRSVVVCLPGGSFNQHYWDAPADLAEGYSFAEALVERGHVVVVLDHIGMGASSTPDDGDQLTAEFVGDCHALAIEQIRSELRSGVLTRSLDPTQDARVVGVGHSNGGCVLLHQQGRHRSYDAVGVFGYSNQFLDLPFDDGSAGAVGETSEAGQRHQAEQMLRGVIEGEWASYLTFDMTKLNDLFFWDDVPRSVAEAREVFYSKTPRGSSIDAAIPGRAAGHAATIDTPVFLCFGERDVSPDVRAEPAAYRVSQEIALVVLPRSAHCHTLASSRELLWARFGAWLDGLGDA